jgi:GxxExxY protein
MDASLEPLTGFPGDAAVVQNKGGAVVLYEGLSNVVLDAVHAVHRGLGSGLLEAPYHNALYYKLRKSGCRVQCNVPFSVIFEGDIVGEYFADLVVDGKIIIEVKSVRALDRQHEAQVLNYLRIAGLRVGYLVNFQGVRVIWKRFIC